jgi:predicted ATPase
VRQLIEQQLTDIRPEDQSLLEVASVVGVEFSVAEVTVGLGQTVEAVEARCEALARQQQFVRPCGMDTWPDGTVTGRYSFQHALYQEILYARVPPSRRRRLHQQIGTRKEVGYGTQARQIAAELAVHFVRGQETWRAVRYLHSAAENALRRSAYQEARTHLSQGLELLHTLPETPERAHLEVALQLARAQPTSWGLGSQSSRATRVRTLCEQLGETSQLFVVLVASWCFITRDAQESAGVEAPSPTRPTPARPALLVRAHTALGISAFCGDFTGPAITSGAWPSEAQRLMSGVTYGPC